MGLGALTLKHLNLAIMINCDQGQHAFHATFPSSICVLCKRVKAWWSGMEKPTRNPGPRFLSSHPALWEWQINGFRSSWASAEAGRAFSRQEWGHRLIRKPSLQSNGGSRPWSGTKIHQSTFLEKATWDLQLCCEFLLSVRSRRTKASTKCSKCEFSSLPPDYQLSEEM